MAQKTPDILKKIVSRKHEEIDEGEHDGKEANEL